MTATMILLLGSLEYVVYLVIRVSLRATAFEIQKKFNLIPVVEDRCVEIGGLDRDVTYMSEQKRSAFRLRR